MLRVKEFCLLSLALNKTREVILAFKKEAHILSALKHPHLPALIDQFRSIRGCYIVMDYIEGEDLETINDETFGQGIAEQRSSGVVL